MNRIDRSHTPERRPHDEALSTALHDVVVPDGLKARLLASVAEVAQQSDHQLSDVIAKTPSNSKVESRTTRRRWLAAGIAASVSGLALGGAYRWTHRALTSEQVLHEVANSLSKADWALTWNTTPSPNVPFPASLRRSHRWQFRSTSVDPKAVAFNLTFADTPAVLFAMKTSRGALFPVASEATPQVLSGREWKGNWNYASIWRDGTSRYLYVLAYSGRVRDFDQFFPGRGPVQLA